MKLKITISVDEGLRNEVAELASVEQRNFSQMWGVLAREALDFRSLREPVAALMKSGEARKVHAAPDSVSVSDVGSPSKPVLGRTEKCIHRIVPTAYCKWCDAVSGQVGV